MNDWLEIIMKVGFPTALVIYFIWRDGKRESRSNAREDSALTRIDQTYAATSQAFKELSDKQHHLNERAVEAIVISNELKRAILDHMDKR